MLCLNSREQCLPTFIRAVKSPGAVGRSATAGSIYVTQAFKEPVGQPYIKLTAMYQTSGQLHYTHELPVPPLTVNGAFVQSRRALWRTTHFAIPGSVRSRLTTRPGCATT